MLVESLLQSRPVGIVLMATDYHNKPVNGFERMTCGGYHAGHPWYYLLGGVVPTPKQIRNEVVGSGYRGYMAEDIDIAAKRAEPKRSEALRNKIRAKVLDGLRSDISRYRQVAFKLHEHPRISATCGKEVISCDNIHTAMSLKHAHIYNGFISIRPTMIRMAFSSKLVFSKSNSNVLTTSRTAPTLCAARMTAG